MKRTLEKDLRSFWAASQLEDCVGSVQCCIGINLMQLSHRTNDLNRQVLVTSLGQCIPYIYKL